LVGYWQIGTGIGYWLLALASGKVIGYWLTIDNWQIGNGNCMDGQVAIGS
jgi:hypothetical protein